MKRLTTNNPETMIENMMNMVFAKDKEVWLRNLGEEGQDISLVDYCKKECKAECDAQYSDDWNAETFGEVMDCDCSVSAFYMVCVGFAEVRQRLMKYEDQDKELLEIKK
ncbi:MAG: hypothetical protein ACREV6_19600 [Clostridium sp.]|uniref:hypothetical protein n=1 Tax=Clostridium sp. TaxID=1506 RepID=UPI003D6D5160